MKEAEQKAAAKKFAEAWKGRGYEKGETHKVIDPLFLDALKKEFEEIKETKQPKTRKQRWKDFQKKLASLTFLDKRRAYLIQSHKVVQSPKVIVIWSFGDLTFSARAA